MSRTRHSAIARYEERIAAYERGAAVPVRRTAPREPRTRAARPGRARRRVSRRRSLRARIRRIIVLASLLLTVDVCASFATAMLKPSNVGFGVRSVEWLRDNGAAWLVSDVERAYYSLTAPSTGGAALKTLPTVGVAGARLAAAYAPPPITPVITPSLPGEGVWQRTGPLVQGGPPILVTTFRPDPNYPDLVAGVAWLDASRTWLQLYPGRYEPPNGAGVRSAEVPQQLRGRLLATFNGAFKLEDSGGGFVAMGRLYAPLRDGLATLVRLRDGTADVRSWSGGPDPGPEVEFARQNLPLIVSGGQLNPNLSDGPQWGATLGNAVRVWRSGVGVDTHGDIIYAAADNQTATSLAEILQRAGAVRAMELDINSEWVTFNFYRASGAGDPAKLLPGMSRDATRYLSPDDRDFFAVYARNG
jgi:Phosphodiester glycosidase